MGAGDRTEGHQHPRMARLHQGSPDAARSCGRPQETARWPRARYPAQCARTSRPRSVAALSQVDRRSARSCAVVGPDGLSDARARRGGPRDVHLSGASGAVSKWGRPRVDRRSERLDDPHGAPAPAGAPLAAASTERGAADSGTGRRCPAAPDREQSASLSGGHTGVSATTWRGIGVPPASPPAIGIDLRTVRLAPVVRGCGEQGPARHDVVLHGGRVTVDPSSLSTPAHR